MTAVHGPFATRAQDAFIGMYVSVTENGKTVNAVVTSLDKGSVRVCALPENAARTVCQSLNMQLLPWCR